MRQLQENTANKNSSVRRTKQNRLILVSSCKLKMNKIVNKFLLAEEFIPELRLRQPGLTYSVCWCFLNSLKGFKIQRNRRFKQQG